MIGIAGMGIAAFWYFAVRAPHPTLIDPTDEGLVVQGQAIYTNSCAACHGAMLQGQPNWRERLANGRLPAPPHDKAGHTWHHPDAVLFDLVKNGLVAGRTAPPGYQSDMPAFGSMLTDEQIVAVLAYIKSTWPSDVLRMQKEVTEQQQRQ
ncbi:mono/diheme cytochrome c family protein [Castellaniella defragrans]|uniref:Mono/diheme cytochrome c family protein n=2 Tax=Castellaniella defragrans TaxID=75697 RepID=A0A7W9TRE0_CASDE|nr:mono/diheme cytochrome c family protein [Castellaniella defragrans]